MALNLDNVFFKANSVLNKLLSKYVGLKLIGFNQSDDNKPHYLYNGTVVTKGFYPKSKKQPVTGEVVDTLRIVPDSDELNTAITKARMVELIGEDGSFTRFSLSTLKAPSPPNYEWVFKIVPNTEDTSVIN